MSAHDVIVVGASAGGVEAISDLVSGLPADLPAAVFVVVHFPASGMSALPRILSRRGPLPAVHASDGVAIEPGTIYVAPPDNHLVIKRGLIRVTHGPRENSHRPAIDPLFRTAAQAYGPRVVAVVLTGMFDDGTAGLVAVKAHRGLAIVQDPAEALFTGMPRSAIDNVSVDHVVPLAEIAPLLARLARELAEGQGQAMSSEQPPDVAELDLAAIDEDLRDGKPSSYACPECHGVLWEVTEGGVLRFRCRVGHAYAAESLLAEQFTEMERSLWIAYRAHKESAALALRMADRARGRGDLLSAARFEMKARQAEQRATLMELSLLKGDTGESISAEDASPPDVSPDGRDQLSPKKGAPSSAPKTSAKGK
jgi:two-component system chemotaxis response regulator CheB